MDTFGQHLLVEYYGCNIHILDDKGRIEEAMNDAAREAGATVVNSTFHTFSPQGVSGVVVVEESHLSIHTWPEHGYATVDFYTCGDCVPERSHELLRDMLEADRAEVLVVQRGTSSEGPSMRVQQHYSQEEDDDRADDPLVRRDL